MFGEGAERFVRKGKMLFSLFIDNVNHHNISQPLINTVRFLDSDGKFVGPVMVAKESRFIEGKLFSVQGKLVITYCQSNRQRQHFI